MNTIGLDIRGTEKGFKSHFGRGTGRYITELVSALDEVSDSTDLELVKLGTADFVSDKIPLSLLNSVPLGKVTLETQVFIPASLSFRDYNFVHYFAHCDAPAFGYPGKTITVLDLIPLKFPELYSRGKSSFRFKFARWLENTSVKTAKGIIAISEATKRDLIEILKVPAEKIIVTPLAVSDFLLSFDNRSLDRLEARRRLGLKEDSFVLSYLGGIDPRKNVSFLLDLLQSLSGSKNASKVCLLLGGSHKKDDQYPVLKERIRELGIEELVLESGFVADEELPDFYHASDLFLFPSLYEGFGLPVLEAMALGVPVIAGDNSSMPELSNGLKDGENGMILLPDNNLESWNRIIQQLANDPGSLKEIGAAAKKRAKEFSWRRTAELTIDAWKSFENCERTAKR